MDIHGRYTEVMVRWMERIEAGEPPLVFGDGLQTMDLIHVTDVARANILAATSPATDTVFNVGSGTETSLLDLARLFAAAMGRPALSPVHKEERAINPVPRRLSSTLAAQEALGFRSTVEPQDGIADLVAWWRSEMKQAEIRELAS
jgi:UDP-glucose 4-epimerase